MFIFFVCKCPGTDVISSSKKKEWRENQKSNKNVNKKKREEKSGKEKVEIENLAQLWLIRININLFRRIRFSYNY